MDKSTELKRLLKAYSSAIMSIASIKHFYIKDLVVQSMLLLFQQLEE